MSLKNYDSAYRKKLDSLTKMKEFIDVTQIDSIKKYIPDSLKKIGDPSRVNCHGYTFNKDDWYAVKNVYDAIETKTIIETTNPEEGDIVIYYFNENKNSNRIRHSGIYFEHKKVRSKWGKGPVFIHDILNVPYEYGEIVKYFKK